MRNAFLSDDDLAIQFRSIILHAFQLEFCFDIIKKEKKKIMSKTISIQLKSIGRTESKPFTKVIPNVHHNNFYRQRIDFADEQIPNLKDQELEEAQKIKKSQKMLFNFIEDPRKTSFAYKKFLLMEKTLFLLTFISFFISMIKTQIQQVYGTDSSEIICHCNSVSCFALIFCVVLRYVAMFELKVHQKKVFLANFTQEESMITLFFMKSSSDIYWLMLQILIIAPHANAIFINKTITLFQSYDQIYITHQINDILGILELLRIYIVLRSLVNASIYSSPRSSRLCQQNGVDHNLLYSIKCILNEEPLRAIFVVFFITLIFLGVGLKLSEGVLLRGNPSLPPTGFEDYRNCFWCVFITMGTIGYGDYFPKTVLGRGMIFATALTGIVLSSILIVSLSAYLQMQASESKSHITLMRLQENQKLKLQASEALCSTMELFRKMDMKEQKNGQKLKSLFSDLKRKIDLVKLRTKKVKCLVNTDNILEEMNRLFQILKDNLRDIYQNQVIMKAVIQKIKIPSRVNRSVRLSFEKELQKAIEVV